MVYYARVPIRQLIPTVLVRLATDEGEVVFRARWNRSPLELQRSILFRLRQGSNLWFETEWGHSICFKPESVWGAVVVGRCLPARRRHPTESRFLAAAPSSSRARGPGSRHRSSAPCTPTACAG